MSPAIEMGAEEIKRFIHNRVSSRPSFKVVIAVSVEKYPSEYSATIWVGQEPSPEMRRYAYELEAELANLGVACSILVKSDKELSVGGVYTLQTAKGPVSYRYYRLDSAGDEDMVYGFAVYEGPRTYRFRMSLTGTLGSMLRSRGRLNEERLLEVYKDWIRARLDAGDAAPDGLNTKAFHSRELSLFALA